MSAQMKTGHSGNSRIERMTALFAELHPAQLEILDDSHRHAGHAGARDGRGHYRISIVSAQFAGKPTVARHRMIYSALGDMMKHDIHALHITARAPQES